MKLIYVQAALLDVYGHFEDNAIRDTPTRINDLSLILILD